MFIRLNFKNYLLIFVCARSSLRVWAFSSRSELGLLSGCGVRVSHGGGFFVVEHRLQVHGLQQLLCGMWNLPRLGIKPVCPALADGFVSTGPPGKSKTEFFILYLGCTTFLVAQMVKPLPTMQETWVRFLGREDPLEKATATHSSTLTWKSQRRRSLVSYSPWGHKESDTTERLHFHFHFTPKKVYLLK